MKNNQTNVELYIFVTPKTKQVYKMTVFLPQRTSWSGLKSDYDEFTTLFTEKYGEPFGEMKKFEKPYEEGDGYEYSALSLGKVSYYTLWMGVQKMNVSVQISKFKQVQLVYENEQLSEVEQKESESLRKNSF